MTGRTEIIGKLKRDIIDGKLNLQQAKDKINELEAQYGQDFFFDSAQVEEKPMPWDAEYLSELEDKSMAGMSSKQFILHLAEVSEYVHSQKSRRKALSEKSPKNNFFDRIKPFWDKLVEAIKAVPKIIWIILLAFAIIALIAAMMIKHNETVQRENVRDETTQNSDYSGK